MPAIITLAVVALMQIGFLAHTVLPTDEHPDTLGAAPGVFIPTGSGPQYAIGGLSDGCAEWSSNVLTSTGGACGGGGVADGTWSTSSAEYWISNAAALDDMSDVDGGQSAFDFLMWDGDSWANRATSTFNIAWDDLVGIPAGFADGVDDGGVGGDGTWSTTSADYWVSNDATLEELSDVDGGQSAWDVLYWDGDSWAVTATTSWDTDTDTTYTAGDALTLTGTDFDFDGGATPGGELGGTWANPTVDSGIHDDEYVELTDSFSGDVSGAYNSTVVADDSHNHVYSNIDAFTEANLYSILTDVTQFYEAGDENTIAGLFSAGALANSIIRGADFDKDNAWADNDIIVYNSAGDDFTGMTCAEITGSADLCDGVDNEGSGSSAEHADAGDYVYPLDGDYHSAPRYVGTSTATSSFKNLAGVLDATQFSGADIGAQINAAYAALPATGGVIYVPRGTYSFSTEIEITTADKPAIIECAPGGATQLTYTGSTGTSTTFNVEDSAAPSTQQLALGIRGCWFYGQDIDYNNTGLEVGGTNGAQGFLLEETRWYTFGRGLYLGDNTYLATFRDNIWNWNGQNIMFKHQPSNSGESIWFHNNLFESYSDDAAGCVDTGGYWTSVQFTDNSFDDCGLVIGEYSLMTNIENNHFENPGGDGAEEYTFITIEASTGGESTTNINGNVFFQAKNTTRPDAYIDNNGGTAIIENNAVLANTYALDNFVDCEPSGAYCELRNNSLSANAVTTVIDDVYAQSTIQYFGYDFMQVKDGGTVFGWNQDTSGNFTWSWGGSGVATSSSNGNWSFENGTTTVSRLDVTTAVDLLGTYADSLDDLCVAITGSADLCDGDDAVGSGGMASFQAEDGDGTEVTIDDAKEWKFVEGTGIDINWTDTSNGSDADPYDLTFALNLASNLTWTGSHNFGGATFLEIPNGTAPTANDPGEIAHDTSDNQLILDDYVVGKATQKIWSTTVASTSVAFISGGLLPVPTELDGYTITAIRCKVDGGTSKVIAVEDASANSTEDITCGGTVTADDGSITNATVTAAEEMYIDFGATTGTVNYVTISVFGQWTRE